MATVARGAQAQRPADGNGGEVVCGGRPTTDGTRTQGQNGGVDSEIFCQGRGDWTVGLQIFRVSAGKLVCFARFLMSGFL